MRRRAPRKLVVYSPTWQVGATGPAYRFVFVKKDGAVIECNDTNNEAVAS